MRQGLRIWPVRELPRRYIRQIYNNLSIVMGTRHANKLINSCSLRAVRGVSARKTSIAICKDARQTMVAQERMPPSARFRPAEHGVQPRRKVRLERNAPGTTTSSTCSPGCQLAGSSPHHVERVYAHRGGRSASGSA